MKMLFIVDYDMSNKNQVIMFVPNDYDQDCVQAAAQECGIRNANVRAIIAVPQSDGGQIIRLTNFYAAYVLRD